MTKPKAAAPAGVSEMSRICGMLEATDAELQCAAIRVLAELAPQDPAVIRAYYRALKADNLLVRGYVLDALARNPRTDAIPHLLPLLEGPDTQKAKVRTLLLSLGGAAVTPLRDALHSNLPTVRHAAVETLGHMPGTEGLAALLDALPQADPETAKQICNAVRGRLESAEEPIRKLITERTGKLLTHPRTLKGQDPAVSALKLAGFLGDPRSADTLIKFVERQFTTAVRSQALHSLSMLRFEGSTAPKWIKRLWPLLSENDLANIVTNALGILGRFAPTKDQEPVLVKLLTNSHAPVRLHAVRSLGQLGSPKAAQLLLTKCFDPDPRLKDEAGRALKGHTAFVKPVTKALLKAPTPEERNLFAGILRSHRDRFDGGSKTALAKKMMALLKHNDAATRTFYDVLRVADPDRCRKSLLSEGLKFKRGKKYPEAERYLSLLEPDDLANPDSRMALAVVRMKQHPPDFGHPDRGPLAPLGLLSRLMRAHPKFDLAKALKGEKKLLRPADWLYIGFHLVEQGGPERVGGAGVLQSLIKSAGRTPEAATAKQKLRTEGL